jgi:hypothetical protein
MVITGIRYKVKADRDTRKTASFTRYLIHYIRMFAILGIAVPLTVGVDYVLVPKTTGGVLTNKFYQITNDQDHIKYSLFTDSHQFNAGVNFYEHIQIGDQLTFYNTPILEILTGVSYQSGHSRYVCIPFSIYRWPVFIPFLTLLCSSIIIIKTQRHKPVRFEPVINLGIINAFLCLFTIAFAFFKITL